jgi:pSer/pThr/pTyr-binding forkhead associated (FHA) protein
MSPAEGGNTPAAPAGLAGTVLARVVRGRAREAEKRFSSTFTVGRSSECDLRIGEGCVSRVHLQVAFDGEHWRLRDLGSANGTFMAGAPVREALLTDDVEIELGKGGVVIALTLEREASPEPEQASPAARELVTETQIIRRYFEKTSTEPAGEQTMMFRRAFQRAAKKKSRKYHYIIGFALLLLFAAGGVIAWQSQKLLRLRKTAENIFYTNKSLELQIAKLEEVVLLHADPAQVAELKAKRLKLKEMEKEYDSFVKEIGVYRKLPEDEQVMLRVARTLGECEVNVPKGFADEVRRYIKMWKSTDRLRQSLLRARSKGYERLIPRVMMDNNLPPQFFFLALQESNFNERAVGPVTRFGHAKGMWQFIPQTASRYGLRVGPLRDLGVYDPQDERFDGVKSTMAAMRYIRDLNNTEGQASGLLVMASYNWGENNIRDIIARMPENPRDRNFWRLLSYKDIPRETYDYVFSIFSAAVICENPRLFGITAPCPAATRQGE